MDSTSGVDSFSHAMMTLSQNVLIEFCALFGVFVVGGVLLTFISRWTDNVCRQFIFPRFGFYAFGLIGIPVHELSHAIFCRLFLHDVQKIKWFDPKGKGGAHGSVTHAYNPWNLYHRMGHFFIGLAPTILGPLILAGLFYWLTPAGRTHFPSPLQLQLGTGANIAAILSYLTESARALTARPNWSSPLFYAFLYLTVCISSQIELSPEDIKQAAKGAPALLIFLFICNLISRWLGLRWHAQAINYGTQLSGAMTSMIALAAVVSAINLLLLTCAFGLINALTRRPAINPFRNGSH